MFVLYQSVENHNDVINNLKCLLKVKPYPCLHCEAEKVFASKDRFKEYLIEYFNNQIWVEELCGFLGFHANIKELHESYCTMNHRPLNSLC